METIKKKQKTHEGERITTEKTAEYNFDKRVTIGFKNYEGEQLGTIDVPLNSSVEDLEEMVNKLMKNEEKLPYTFFFETLQISNNIAELVKKLPKFNTEIIIPITYHPQSLFIVKPITRQTSSLEGHSESVLNVQFSPDSNNLASASGDGSVRFWDISTETPTHTCKGHTHWVLLISWSPDGKFLASGSMDNTIRIWNPLTGKQFGNPLKSHKQCVTSISWEPLHASDETKFLASGSKDNTLKIWNVLNQTLVMTLTSHTGSITKVIWGGQGLIYSASQDRTIKAWTTDGELTRDMKKHGHWVNTLALHTDYALRVGCYDEKKVQYDSREKMKVQAIEKYNKAKGSGNERLVSGSDDFTLFMWDPVKTSEPVTRMTGHQQPINHIAYSPDGKYVVSASYDKSLRLWDGFNGTYISTFRGHVGPVYQVSWSIDSRLFVSGSNDTTIKVWNIKSKKLMHDLPGHADAIFTLDWSPDGEKVASGGKDRLLKLWRN